jgi:hypothetical protein
LVRPASATALPLELEEAVLQLRDHFREKDVIACVAWDMFAADVEVMRDFFYACGDTETGMAWVDRHNESQTVLQEDSQVYLPW